MRCKRARLGSTHASFFDATIYMAEQVEEARSGEQQMQLLEQHGRYLAAELWRPTMGLRTCTYVRACPHIWGLPFGVAMVNSQFVWIGEDCDAAIQVAWDTFIRRRVIETGDVYFASSVDRRKTEYKELLASVAKYPDTLTSQRRPSRQRIPLEMLFRLRTI